MHDVWAYPFGGATSFGSRGPAPVGGWGGSSAGPRSRGNGLIGPWKVSPNDPIRAGRGTGESGRRAWRCLVCTESGAGARTTRAPASVHSGGGPAAGQAPQVPGWLRRKTARDQVFVGCPPHRARRALLPPAARALGAVAPLVGLVGGEQRPPPLGQFGKFGSGHGQQGWCVRAIGQLGQHVQPFPHRVAQYLPEDLVHRNVTVTFPPLRRLRAGRL